MPDLTFLVPVIFILTFVIAFAFSLVIKIFRKSKKKSEKWNSPVIILFFLAAIFPAYFLVIRLIQYLF